MIKGFIRAYKRLRKSVILSAFVGLAIGLPASSLAAQTPHLATSSGISNVSAGQATFRPSVQAKVGQQLELHIDYGNTAKAGSHRSVHNFAVRVNIPSLPGSTQTITSTLNSSNANTVSSSVKITSSSSNAVFVYSPGTAVLYQNGGQKKVSDDIVASPNGVSLGTLKAGQSGFINLYGSLEVPSQSGFIVKNQSELASQKSKWSASNTAQPGDTMKYLLTFQDTGGASEHNVTAKYVLPAGLTYIPNTTLIFNPSSPNGAPDKTNQLVTNGLNIGNYLPSQSAFVEFNAKIADSSQLKCGTNTLSVVGSAQPQGMQAMSATATTTVDNQCNPGGGTPACTIFTVLPGANNTATISQFQTTMPQGASFTDAVIDWGDGTLPFTTTQPQGQNHPYPNADPRTIHATAHFNIGGKDVTAFCPAPTINFSSAPTSPNTSHPTPSGTNSSNSSTNGGIHTAGVSKLVNTGAGNVIGLFVGASLIGFFGYRLFLRYLLTQ